MYLEIRNLGYIKYSVLNFNFSGLCIKKLSNIEASLLKFFLKKEEEFILSNKNFNKKEMEFYCGIENLVNSFTEIVFKNYLNINLKNNFFRINDIKSSEYFLSKNVYIPNNKTVITLPELTKIRFGDCYIQDYLSEWFKIKQFYTKENPLEILDTGYSYYFNKNTFEDKIVFVGNECFLQNVPESIISLFSIFIFLYFFSKKTEIKNYNFIINSFGLDQSLMKKIIKFIKKTENFNTLLI